VPVVDEPNRATRLSRELGREDRLDAGALLRAEPASDERRDHTHLGAAKAEPLRELVSRPEHPLGGQPSGQLVAVPDGDGCVRLERRLQMVGRLELEHHRRVGGGKRLIDVAPGRFVGVARESLILQRRVGIDDVGLRVDLGRQRDDAGRRVLRRISRYDGEGLSCVLGLLGEGRCVVERNLRGGRQHDSDAGGSERRRHVQGGHARMRNRGPQHRGVQHPGQADVHRVLRLAGDLDRRVLARRLAADDRELGADGPGLEVVLLVDERPDLLDASLHLAGAADEARHHAGPAARRIARSIFG
jgi:hypothetical protein